MSTPAGEPATTLLRYFRWLSAGSDDAQRVTFQTADGRPTLLSKGEPIHELL
jgi:hypothetical protein